MPVSRLTHVVAQLSLADDARSDSDLLTQFLTFRDERAFAILIHRHAPGVRAVCRGWLRSAADIDDATQATFLVLLRRAESIRDRSMVGQWLYRTAGFVARRLKQHPNRTRPLPDDLHARSDSQDSDERTIVSAEIGRLPEPYRLAIQLHYEAGLTAAAMADRLNCPRSTVLSRLTRGRSILRRRLLARGVVPAVLASPVGIGLSTSPAWALAFARSAIAFQTGGTTFAVTLSARSVSLSEGVVRTMFWKHFQVFAVVAMIATGLSAFFLGQWASADGPKKPVDAVTVAAQPGKPNADEPAIPGGRREAVIRMPVGTFMKEVDLPPYGAGRITWTYENDRVRGQIALSGMGAEVELATEAEISMASNGTIYGIVTGFKVNHVKLPAELRAEMTKELAGLEIEKAWPLVEPVVNDVMTDLPFSYSFRLVGDRLTILNYRILLAGPNPFGKLGGIAAGGDDGLAVLAYFQAIGTAIEGSYTVVEADQEKEAPKKRPVTSKSVFPPSGKK